jgi:hypothetical protein
MGWLYSRLGWLDLILVDGRITKSTGHAIAPQDLQINA